MINDQREAREPGHDIADAVQPASNEKEQWDLIFLASTEHRIPDPGLQTLHFAPIERPADDGAKPKLSLVLSFLCREDSGIDIGLVRRDMRNVSEPVGELR